MKRLYYGHIRTEVHDTVPACCYNTACVLLAQSEEEAIGIVVSSITKQHPTGKVVGIQMYPVPDDQVLEAAAELNRG